jgi:ADP-ribosyl-[dinitrogen reductase] hydrolase
MNKKERFSNAFYAQAVCDAVGDPFEFDSDINPSDVLDYAKYEDVIEITDDTQMALFIAEYLNLSSIDTLYKTEYAYLRLAYLAWYETQSDNHDFDISSMSKLKVMPEMRKKKSPGNTCLNSCHDLLNDIPVENDSKGCGSVMRILPFAWFDDPILGTELAILSANITHKHKENVEAVKYLMEVYFHAKNDRLLPYAEAVNHISDIGDGWTALEAVKMAHWAVTMSTTFEELLVCSIAHDGDSDSVAAIAGSIWGLLGRDVPNKYIIKIAEKSAIDYVLNLPLYRE